MGSDRLDDDAIEALRSAVSDLASAPESHLPLARLVGHHSSLAPFGRMTVDFGAGGGEAPIIILREAARDDARLDKLSAREREVARLVADGLANKEIAVRLRLSVGTVKDHVHNILKKIELPNRAAVAALFSPSN